MTKSPVFGFLGCGNMGAALARAAAKSLSPEQILLSNRSPEKAEALAKALGCTWGDNALLAEKSDFLFLGVKPQMLPELMAQLRPLLAARNKPCVLVTMAAGVSMATVRELSATDWPIIRIMPNTPCAVGAGMLLCTAKNAAPEQLEQFSAAMAASGKLDWLDEALIDAGSAVSGCGPAFVYLFAEALADGGVACGLPRRKAQLYTAQTLLGAAQQLLDSDAGPGPLKDAVCSPGGTTIQGVRALEEKGLRSAAMEAVLAAYEKTLELGGKK